MLVTGASGSMGGSLSLWLAERGAQVQALVRSPEKAAFLHNVAGIKIVQGDLSCPESLLKAVQGCRFVFHCGAALSGGMAVQWAGNVDGTRNMARAAAQAGVERMVHISTISVYPMIKGDVTEETEITPDNGPYPITKVEAEKVLIKVACETGLRYSVIRPGAIYGPRGHWTKNIMALARNNPIWFIGQGTGVLPLIYMEDLLEECLICATHPSAEGEAFNGAYSPHPSIKRVLLAFAAASGHHNYVGIPVAPVRGLVRLLAAIAPASSQLKMGPALFETILVPKRYSMEKAKRLLGWQPKVDVDEGVQKSLSWMREVGLLKQV